MGDPLICIRLDLKGKTSKLSKMCSINKKPTVLIIRDGWGENHDSAHDSYNAVKLAYTPVADRICKEGLRTEISASGLAVGLPDRVMGNSEVGHQNIGAGRIVDQELVRINKGLKNRSLLNNPTFQRVLDTKKSGGAIHLMGIVSDAGVHGMLAHLYDLVRLAESSGVEELYLHAFTDGRDTPPKSGLEYIKEVEGEFAKIGLGKIATVTGRYWALDRDFRWDRVEKAYQVITNHAAEATASSAIAAVQNYYDQPIDGLIGDEFIPATQVLDVNGDPVGFVRDGDAVVFYNYRGDRPREITQAFIEESFDGFDRGKRLQVFFATMTEYKKNLCPHVLFPKPPQMNDTLGAYLSKLGISQFRCAETEKFPHVTFFFNDYREEAFPGEKRVIIPSPKDCKTYDQKPEMSAQGVLKASSEAIDSGEYALIVVNFANPDMVGHTGSVPAAVKACEIVDRCVGDLLEKLAKKGGNALVTADHGNCDQMYNPVISAPHTSHTLNPVEVVILGPSTKGKTIRSSGVLGDIAPTLLALMDLEKPAAMTGSSLLVDQED